MTKAIRHSLLYLSVITAFLILGQSDSAKQAVSQLKSRKTTVYFGHLLNLPATSFCALYDGEIVDIQDASFTIKDQFLAVIYILFVDINKLQFCLEDYTVQKILLNTSDYKIFELQATQFPAPSDLKNSYSSSWKISEITLKDKAIPLNTIIIPISPNLAEISLQNIISKPSNLAVKLPSISLVPKKNHKLKDLMAESYLKTIALKPFYTKQRVKSIKQDAIKISLII